MFDDTFFSILLSEIIIYSASNKMEKHRVFFFISQRSNKGIQTTFEYDIAKIHSQLTQ